MNPREQSSREVALSGLDIIILVGWLAFFHSIQLEKNLAPGTAFALKMAH